MNYQFQEGERYKFLAAVLSKHGIVLSTKGNPDISRARGLLRKHPFSMELKALDDWLVSLAVYTDTLAGPPRSQSNKVVYWPHEQTKS